MNSSAAIKVSVIVPVHNTAKFLPECLDSICSQTLQEIEIICVDDDSTDSSAEVLKQYAKRDPRIQLIWLKDTGPGAADARNAGLRAAKGEYLSFLDSDDRFDETLLQKTYEKGKALSADIVMYDARSFDSETGRFTDVGTYLVSGFLPDKEVFSKEDFENGDVFRITNGAAWCMLFRRDFIVDNGITFKAHHHTDDLFFTYSSLVSAGRITAIREKLLFYRDNNSSSQTSRRTLSPLSATDAWCELKESLENKGQLQSVRVGFMNKALAYCRWYLEHIGTAEAFSVLFTKLHQSAIKDLGFDKTAASDFYDRSLFDWCVEVTGKDETEFLFDRLQQTDDKLYAYDPEFAFPKEHIKPEERVVLYGAGNVGKRFFTENLKNGYCKIVAWADKHADAIGGMFIMPEKIKEIKYDRIVLAASSDGVRESMEKDLREFGIEMRQ